MIDATRLEANRTVACSDCVHHIVDDVEPTVLSQNVLRGCLESCTTPVYVTPMGNGRSLGTLRSERVIARSKFVKASSAGPFETVD